jgi:hypothetical protein
MLGDPFTAMALIDDDFLAALLGVGPETIALDVADTSFDLDINGLLLFDETDDTGFGAGFPTAVFDNGNFVGFEFISNSFTVGTTEFEVSLFEDDLEIANLDLEQVDATGTAEVSPD